MEVGINVEGGFLFCGGWNFSKSVSVGFTFIREMRVFKLFLLQNWMNIDGTTIFSAKYFPPIS